MPLFREDEALITATVANISFPPFFVWSSLEGGDAESNDTKVWPGGMQPQVSLGGPRTRTDATIKTPYSPALHALLVPLENVAGNAAMSVSYTPLDASGNPAANSPTVTLHGILKTVTRPNYEASAQAAAMLSLVMSCHAEASTGN